MKQTCGDFGGKHENGSPCGLAAGWGTSEKDGPCRKHRTGEARGANLPDPSQLKKAAFLTAFADNGNVTLSAQAADISRRLHYAWLDGDPEYRAAFEHAHREATDVLEDEARRRAVVGWSEPVGFHKGHPATYVQRYSDTLLIFLLKGNNPTKFRDRVEHSGVVGMPERPEDYHNMTDEDIARRAALASSRAIGKAP